MKFFLISDNIDTLMGMRLGGIEGTLAHEKDEVKAALEKAMCDHEVAVVLITQKLVNESEQMVYDLKLNRRYPLILEIPDRHGSSHISTSISKYVREAVGIRI